VDRIPSSPLGLGIPYIKLLERHTPLSGGVVKELVKFLKLYL